MASGRSKLAAVLHAGHGGVGDQPVLLQLISDTPRFLMAYAATHGAWVYGLLFMVVFAEVCCGVCVCVLSYGLWGGSTKRGCGWALGGV
jgi:hypothetical protein